MDNAGVLKIIAGLTSAFGKGLFEWLKNRGIEKYEERQIDIGAAFEIYLRSSYVKYSKMKTIINKEDGVGIIDFYVNPNVRYGNKVLSNIDKVESLASISHQMLIVGSAGQGKSTMLKFFLLKSIEEKRVPVFIELRDYNIKKQEGDLIDFIYESMQTRQFKLDIETLRYAFEKGGFLFLFDGFDEVNKDKCEEVKREIINMTDRYPNNYYMVSSRPDNEFISWDNFTQFKICGFDKSQACQMIDRLRYDELIKGRFKEILEKKLYDMHKDFASNPLLLTIMLLTFENYIEIPREKHIFYRRAFETLYCKHDATKGFQRERKTKLSETEFVKAVSIFSIFSFIDNKTNFERETVMEFLNKTKKIMQVDFKEEDLLNDLLKAVSLLLEDGLKYEYTHKSFQEYFAARFIADSSDELQRDLMQRLMLKTDLFAELLYGINKEKVEELYLIPMLEEIKVLLGYELNAIEANENYICQIYKTIYQNQGGVSLIYNNNIELYMKYQLICRLIDADGRHQQQKSKVIATEVEKVLSLKGTKIERNFIHIMDAMDGKWGNVIKDAIVRGFSGLDFMMQVLDELKKKHDAKKESLEELLSI